MVQRSMDRLVPGRKRRGFMVGHALRGQDPSPNGSRPSAIAHHVARTARQGDEAAVALLRAAGDAAAARAPASVARWYAAGPSPPRGCDRRPARPELEFAFGTLAM